MMQQHPHTLALIARENAARLRREAAAAAAARAASRDPFDAPDRAARRSRRFGAAALLLALLVAAVGPVHAAEPAPPMAAPAETPRLSPTDPASIAAFFDALLTRQVTRPDVPGAVVAVVQGGKLRLVEGYGLADVAAGSAMDGERTLVRPGSSAKPITWAAVLLLAHDGVLDLRADVQDYLDFPLPGGFEAPVTLTHLITHTAGFEDVGERLFVLDPAERMPLATYLRDLAPARVYPPGAVQAYSNYGTALAGYVVERMSGVPFADFVERRVFAPAGMAHATWEQPPGPAEEVRLAVGYGLHAGELVPGDFEVVTPVPAGGLSATAADMGRFALAQLGHGGALPEAVRSAMQGPAYAADPRLRGVTLGFMDAQVRGVRALHHDGDTYLFRSSLVLLPEHDLGWFVAYNGPGGGAARRELLDAVAAALSPQAPLAPTWAADAMGAPIAGEFHLARAEHSGMGKVLTPLMAAEVRSQPDGSLHVIVDGRSETYLPVAPDAFRHADRDDLLVVGRDAEGRAWLHFDAGPPFEAFIATSARQAPWYATRGALAATLLLPVVGYGVVSLGWLLAGWRRRRRGERLASTWRGVRVAALGAGAAHAAFLVAFATLLLDVHPAYGVPRVLFGATPALAFVTWVPWALALAALALVVATVTALVAAHRRGHGGHAARAIRSLALASVSWAALASLAHWNVWRWPL